MRFVAKRFCFDAKQHMCVPLMASPVVLWRSEDAGKPLGRANWPLAAAAAAEIRLKGALCGETGPPTSIG